MAEVLSLSDLMLIAQRRDDERRARWSMQDQRLNDIDASNRRLTLEDWQAALDHIKQENQQ